MGEKIFYINNHPFSLNPLMTRAPNFKFQARKVFLTYPRSNLTKDELYTELHAAHPIKLAYICIENHEDGTPHLHAAITFEKKIVTRRPDVFDVQGFHPNIQAVRNWNASVNYVKKDKDYSIYNNSDDDDDDDDDLDLFEKAKTMSHNEYFTYCLKKKVPGFYADKAWRQVGDMFTVDESYVIPEEATVRPSLMSIDLSAATYDNRSILLIGPSGAGKTVWAKHVAEKPALFVTHTDGIRNLQPNHKSIIFDDMSYLHVPREAQIAITDRFEPRQIHVRYGTVSVPAGIQKIFTANNEIFSADPAIDRRISKIYLQ